MTRRSNTYYFTAMVYGSIKTDTGRAPSKKIIKEHVKENINKFIGNADIENIENEKNQTSYLVKEEK